MDVAESVVAFSPSGGGPMISISTGNGLDSSATGTVSQRPISVNASQAISAKNSSATSLSANVPSCPQLARLTKKLQAYPSRVKMINPDEETQMRKLRMKKKVQMMKIPKKMPNLLPEAGTEGAPTSRNKC